MTKTKAIEPRYKEIGTAGTAKIYCNGKDHYQITGDGKISKPYAFCSCEPVKSSHSPLPWKLEIIKDGGNWEYNLRETNDKHVASLNRYLKPDADAAFIVKAVNSHEALVSALKNIRDLQSSKDYQHVKEDMVRNMVDNALKAAGE